MLLFFSKRTGTTSSYFIDIDREESFTAIRVILIKDSHCLKIFALVSFHISLTISRVMLFSAFLGPCCLNVVFVHHSCTLVACCQPGTTSIQLLSCIFFCCINIESQEVEGRFHSLSTQTQCTSGIKCCSKTLCLSLCC